MIFFPDEIEKLNLTFIGLFLAAFLLSAEAEAQSTVKNRSLFAEVLGPGVFGSVNYDFRFHPGTKGPGMRVGVGMVPDVLVFPVELYSYDKCG